MSSEIRSAPCQACPYRRDVPSGVWEPSEYAKLPPYDRPTMQQPPEAFACHATPDHLCHGWAVVGFTKVPHTSDLLAGRFGQVAGEIPDETVPLFDSHTEAAEHGMREVENPSPEAREVTDRLVSKYARLRES